MSGRHGNPCIRRGTRRQSRDDATADSGTNAGLQSGDWIEGSTTRLGYPRHPSRILPRANGGGKNTLACHAVFVSCGMWLCCGELCAVHGR